MTMPGRDRIATLQAECARLTAEVNMRDAHAAMWKRAATELREQRNSLLRSESALHADLDDTDAEAAAAQARIAELESKIDKWARQVEDSAAIIEHPAAEPSELYLRRVATEMRNALKEAK